MLPKADFVSVDTKEMLIGAIQARFTCRDQRLLQQPCEDDRLDMDDVVALPDSGKLRFIKTTTSHKDAMFVMTLH
jgi:hypothetical protein